MSDDPRHPPRPVAAILRGEAGAFHAIPGTGFEMREAGLAAASGGRHTARMFRTTSGGDLPSAMHVHDADFQYVHVLRGEIDFELADGGIKTLRAGDAIWLPKGCPHSVRRVTDDLEFLEIFSPAEVATLPEGA